PHERCPRPGGSCEPTGQSPDRVHPQELAAGEAPRPAASLPIVTAWVHSGTLAASSLSFGLIQDQIITTQIRQNSTKIPNATGRLMKSSRLPCDLISVEMRFFSRIGPITMPSTHGA